MNYKAVETFIKDKQLIENMDTGDLSNCPIEGINRKIKRMAYDYKNWEYFIFWIRIEFKIKVQKKNPIRKWIEFSY